MTTTPTYDDTFLALTEEELSYPKKLLTEEEAKFIIDRLAAGETIIGIAFSLGKSRDSIYYAWDKSPAFKAACLKAQKMRRHVWEQRLHKELNRPDSDFLFDDGTGKLQVHTAAATVSKTRIDALRWLMACEDKKWRRDRTGISEEDEYVISEFASAANSSEKIAMVDAAVASGKLSARGAQHYLSLIKTQAEIEEIKVMKERLAALEKHLATDGQIIECEPIQNENKKE